MKKSKKQKMPTSTFYEKYDKVYAAVCFAQNNDEWLGIEKGDLVADYCDLINLIPKELYT